MFATTIFPTGGSHAVRIPKDLLPSSKRVTLHREKNRLIISPAPHEPTWADFARSKSSVSDDFMETRVQLKHSRRD